MATTTSPVPPTPQAARIYEAECASGPSGAVLRGAEIDVATAVARRRAEHDVVVCGNDLNANRDLAGRIEATVGPRSRPQAPEAKAGPLALPHFHQLSRSPKGHTFYETARLKTRKKP